MYDQYGAMMQCVHHNVIVQTVTFWSWWSYIAYISNVIRYHNISRTFWNHQKWNPHNILRWYRPCADLRGRWIVITWILVFCTIYLQVLFRVSIDLKKTLLIIHNNYVALEPTSVIFLVFKKYIFGISLFFLQKSSKSLQIFISKMCRFFKNLKKNFK